MKTKFGIVGCGFLGNIAADAWKKGLLEDYELVGVTSRTFASAEKTASAVGYAACADVDALLALEPEYIVEAASVEAVRAMAVPVLRRGVSLVVLSIGAFADLAFYEEVKQAAREGGAKVHLASAPTGTITKPLRTCSISGRWKQAAPPPPDALRAWTRSRHTTGCWPTSAKPPRPQQSRPPAPRPPSSPKSTTNCRSWCTSIR